MSLALVADPFIPCALSPLRVRSHRRGRCGMKTVAIVLLTLLTLLLVAIILETFRIWRADQTDIDLDPLATSLDELETIWRNS